MEISMKDSGKIMLNVEKEHLYGKMDKFMRENI